MSGGEAALQAAVMVRRWRAALGSNNEIKTTPRMFLINSFGKVVCQGSIDSIRSVDSADIDKAENYVSQCLDAGQRSLDLEFRDTYSPPDLFIRLGGNGKSSRR